MSRKKKSKNEWVSQKISRKNSRKSKGIKKWMSCEKILENPPSLLRAYSSLDFGISCLGEGDQKMSKFRKKFSKILRPYLSPSTLESRVQEKGVKNWVSCENIYWKISGKSSVLALPSTLESRVQEKGIKKWVSFEQILPKSSVPATLPPVDFGISCPGEEDQKRNEFRKKFSKILCL